MKDVLVDSNVILDIFENDPIWADWSMETLQAITERGRLCINHIIYTEISIGFKRIEEVEEAIAQCGLKLTEIPREALFLAGKAFLKYRRDKGDRKSILPDFYIGAHAAVTGMVLVTRDVKRIRYHFPTVSIISPD